MTKACSKCKEHKPENEFAVDRQKKDGLRSDCRVCRSIFYQKNAARVIADVAKYQAKNADRVSARKRLAYAREKEIQRAKKRAYYYENKEMLLARGVSWRRRNAEMLRAKSAEYRARAAPQIRIRNLNRIARLKAAPGRMSKGIVDRLLALQRGKCACCGEPLGRKFHLDHILPLALGGGNDDSNLQLLKPLCNLKKSAKHPVDFMQSKGFLL